MPDTLPPSPFRTYDRTHAAVFLRTKEAFGGLSNMASGFPLRVNGVRILTSEALYQACRFPHLPNVQRQVIAQHSPMAAKMAGKPHRGNSRPDWDAVRVRIMRWCLRAKLVQNFAAFSGLLLSTTGRPIVEESRKDDFWGAKPNGPSTLTGQNVLGRLLMELREEVAAGARWPAAELQPLDIPDFLLYEQLIRAIEASAGRLPVLSIHPPAAPAPRPMPPTHKDRMTQPAARKKLIEVSIPLEAINKASAREKSIRHGHPSTLHLWWARRPLAACRAVLFAQLVDDPSSWPDRFPDAAAVERERARLHKVIERIVPWEASNDEAILQEARHEIARSVAWGLGEEPPASGDRAGTLRFLQEKAPPVYDPFSGGGSIPLEAQRLGLRAHGSDLNPVAVLIGKALVEIPPRFAGLPPVNPTARASLPSGGWRGAAGLAADVRHYGAWMRDEAARRIGHLYPKAQLPGGGEATVIAWLWARTVRSPDPAARGAMVPLVSSFMLSTKEGRKAWAEVVPDPAAPDGWRFEVRTGALAKADEERLKKGTKTGRGSNFACVLTGTAINGDTAKAEGMAGRLGARLMAIVAEGGRTRAYLPPDPAQEALAATASPAWQPEGDLPNDPRNFWTVQYGFGTFASLFTPRQLVAMTTFSDLVSEAKAQIQKDACRVSLSSDITPLHKGGAGAVGYSDAVATYLAFAVSKASSRSCSLTIWETGMGRLAGAMGRQALPMQWSFAETNPLAGAGGDIAGTAVSVAENLERMGAWTFGSIRSLAAQQNTFASTPVIISTDPPYYDNIGYADLSDFFYVWLRRTLSDTWPELFRRLTTPKDMELVATPYRHGGKQRAEKFFMDGMSAALVAIRKAAADDMPVSIYYGFKQSETDSDGTTSAGWASFLQAIVDSGLALDGTWPLRTEATNALKANVNALASSIVLVCRKRPDDAPVTTRAEFVRTLRRELPDAVAAIRRAGVGPVDMQQSVIGPGMGVFTRHAHVLEDDDSPMPVRTALSLINRVWDEIENEATELLDPPSQVALAWFAAYGFDVRPAGDLITLANAKNLPAAVLFAAGVFHDGRGRAALTPRDQLPSDWTPADGKASAWGCVQHAIRTLNAPDGGATAAAALLAAMGPMAEPARALAYRLFQIATEKGWAAEALAYNALAEEWPHLLDLAPQPGHGPADTQAELFSA